VSSVVELTESEQEELEWWCKHHKSNVIYLINRIDELLKENKYAEGILRGALIGYREHYLGIDPEGSESESETKAAE